MSFDKLETVEATGRLAKGPADFYTKYTAKFPEGKCSSRHACGTQELHGQYRYTIEVLQKGKQVAKVQCDALHLVDGSGLSTSRVSETLTTDGLIRGCRLNFSTGGETTFRVTLSKEKASPNEFVKARVWVLQD